MLIFFIGSHLYSTDLEVHKNININCSPVEDHKSGNLCNTTFIFKSFTATQYQLVDIRIMDFKSITVSLFFETDTSMNQ